MGTTPEHDFSQLHDTLRSITFTDPNLLKKDLLSLRDTMKDLHISPDSQGFNLVEEVLDTTEHILSIEKTLSFPGRKFTFIGQIGSGKSSIVSSLIPSIKLSPGELLDNYRYSVALKKYKKKLKEHKEKNKSREEKGEKIVPFSREKPQKYEFTASSSKKIERSSLLHTGKGRTTLAKTIVILDPDASEMSISFTSIGKKETLSYIQEYLDYLFTPKERKHKEYFPEEIARFIRNSSIRPHLLSMQGKGKHAEIGNREIDSFISEHVKNNLKDELEYTILSMFETKADSLFLSYRESTFKKAFPSLYKKVSSEPLENKRLRFFKMIMKHVNAGNIGNIRIPSSVKIIIPEKKHKEKIILIDTKGTEKSDNSPSGVYLNRDILSLMEDDKNNAVFVSRFEDAPSPDVVEILAESSVSEKLKNKSTVLVSIKDHSISEKEIEDKKIQCENILPLMKNNFHFYDSFWGMTQAEPALSGENQSVFNLLLEIDESRRRALESSRQKLLSEISFRLEWFHNVFSEEEGSQIYSLLRRIDGMKNTSVSKRVLEKKQIETSLTTSLLGTHHSIINASMRRSGVYDKLDIPSLLSIKIRSLISDVFSGLSDYLQADETLLDLELKKRRVFHAAFDAFERGEKEKLRSFCFSRINAIIEDPSFWDEACDEWGKGPGYRKRVLSLFLERGNIPTMDASISDQVTAIIFEDILSRLNVLYLEK